MCAYHQVDDVDMITDDLDEADKGDGLRNNHP